jgi:hypothetical protein
MSTLDVSCARCDKRFRVRAEFAGKTTRCPGCSAPITIGASKAPPPPHSPRADRKDHEKGLRADYDDRPRRPAGNWKPVAAALGREQVAVVFALLTILGSYLVVCLGNAAGGPSGAMEGVVIGAMMLVLVGPSLVAAVFAVTARVAAVGAPVESLAKGSAVASLLCAFGGLAALIMLGLTLLASIDQRHASDLPAHVAIGGLAVSTLGAVGTFLGFVAQIGIARRSAEVSRAVGRTAVAVCVCVLVLLGIGMLYALAVEATGPSTQPSFGPGYRSYPDDGPFYMVMTGFLIPLGLTVVLIMYHRLLAAARRAVLEGPGRLDASE